MDGARENEAAAGGFYSGVGKSGGKSEKGKGLKAGFLKKKGPTGLIIGLIFGVGGLVGGSQMLQPFSVLENLRETFNSMQVSVNKRSNTFFKKQMDANRNVKNPIKSRIFRTDTFKITSRQAKKLSQQGIDFDDDFKVEINGKTESLRVLKFDDGTGDLRIVAADDATAAKLNSIDLTKVSTGVENVKFNKEAISFRSLYTTNSDFYYGYNKGSKTWRGAISGWFGSMTLKFISNNKLTRNLFKNWQEEAQKAIDGNTKQVAVDLMEKGTDEVKEGGAKVLTGEEEKVEGENGEDTTKIVEKTEESGSGTFNRKNVKSEADVKTQLQKIGDSYGAKAGKVANTSCMVLNVVGGIGLLISAAENLQIIRLAMQFFEAVDKVKAGFGDGSPINVFATSLNENKKQSYNVLTNLTQGTAVDLNSFTEEGDVVGLFDTEIMPYSGSAMESNGIATLYGGVMDPDDPSVQSFNFSKSFGTVLGGLGSDMDDFKGCLLSKAGTAAASAISDGMKITSCIAGLLGAAVTWGGSAAVGCGPLVAGFAKDIAVGIIKGIVISGIISVITPIATKLLTRNLIANLGGQDFGNALKKGSGLLFGNTGLTNGLSLATEDEYLAFAVAQQEVIAENAQYERMSRDPFDATSKYTFLGTLANSLMKFSTSNSLMSTIMSGGTVISSAITSLMPTSSAVDLTEQVISVEEGYDEICPYLASIGAVGDVYCNPYTITDMSTIEMDPADVEYELERDGKSNFEDELTEDGNVIIKDNSPLAKYVVFCNNRTSAWGFADQNVVNAIEKGTVDVGNGAANTVLNSGIGAIPIIGDTFDIINSKISFDNIGYISGESCVAGNMVDNAEAPNWEEAKMYQRFIEDQSLAETIGLIEESAVTAYLDKYYEENPLDQSYEGILARYSGLEKEDVIALLDVLEYGNYIANYDSTTRYAFVEKDEGDEIDMEFYENQFEQVLSTPVYALVYPELRYRNFTV